MERLFSQFKLALPLLSGILVAIGLARIGPAFIAALAMPLDVATMSRSLGEGVDVASAGLHPALASVSSFVGANADMLRWIAAGATAVLLAALVIESSELLVAYFQQRLNASSNARTLSTSSFWTGVATVPLAALAIPSATTAVVAGVFACAALARARLVRLRITQ